MGDRSQRQSSWLRDSTKKVPWFLLAAQSVAFVLLAHYSRIMPPAGGKRYLTSTAVFMSEVVKLAITLTIALYDVSKNAPPSMPATSLFFSLSNAVLSGDSWKLAIPACLGVMSNSLQYVALSNMSAATFTVTFQLQFVTVAVLGLVALRRSISPRNWGLLLLLLVGVALVHFPNASVEQQSTGSDNSHLHFPRSLEEWKAARGVDNVAKVHKRSATYEGIEEDILTANPRMSHAVGMLAVIGAALTSGVADVYFEKVLKDSPSHISLWVRNVQLSLYSIFPALFVGILFQDGERIANDGFFQGYNLIVWATILIQTLGGVLSTFALGQVYRDPHSLTTTTSIVLSIVGSIWLFEFELTASFFVGAAAVLVATHYYGNPIYNHLSTKVGGMRPPPIRVDSYEKDVGDGDESPAGGPPDEISIKLPTSPFLSDGVSSSRPTSPGPGHVRLRSVQSSQIIITTPEKWDSITRKWKDHMRLMQLVKLFLIDEVHILKETRGATLEAVVSRMKNIGSNVRFVALSATVPNSEDIATWLGKDATNQHIPAHREHFGEDFRPVKLQKFVYGYHSTGNDFVLDKICGSKLPEVLGKHSCQKPIMVFCCTRNSAVTTAKELVKVWNSTNPPARLWKGQGKRLSISNDDLKATTAAGVAFHHAGLSAADRLVVEKGFLEGQVNVICCTSTLAVGVNLPCQLVIIKNTVCWQDGGWKQYSDLEMMQMLGRAGRPQFDDTATAVILTRKDRVAHYERLISGSESLESCLHLNLIEHLNAEIGLGIVSDIPTAIKWLSSTFLFVRLRRNPGHYKLQDGNSQDDKETLLKQICEKDLELLRQNGLVDTKKTCTTAHGDAMARYYVRFETMKKILSLKTKSDIPDILNVLCQAEEFREFRLKITEKALYREINKDSAIRFPIEGNVVLAWHKVSLILQSELGAVEFPASGQLQKHKFIFQQEKSEVFAHMGRLIRCLIDCSIAKNDSVTVRNALELARSFGAKVWDHSPLQMKQIEQIGIVAVRKLAAAGIKDIQELEVTEAPRIDMILSKNPPFGVKVLSRLKDFPKLRVTLKVLETTMNRQDVNVRFKVEVAFMNDNNTVPAYFHRKPVFVCCLTEISDGRLVDFRRISATKFQNIINFVLTAKLTSQDQHITSHVMCDDIAGTSQQARIEPEFPAGLVLSEDEHVDVIDPSLEDSFVTSNSGASHLMTPGPEAPNLMASNTRTSDTEASNAETSNTEASNTEASNAEASNTGAFIHGGLSCDASMREVWVGSHFPALNTEASSLEDPGFAYQSTESSSIEGSTGDSPTPPLRSGSPAPSLASIFLGPYPEDALGSQASRTSSTSGFRWAVLSNGAVQGVDYPPVVPIAEPFSNPFSELARWNSSTHGNRLPRSNRAVTFDLPPATGTQRTSPAASIQHRMPSPQLQATSLEQQAVSSVQEVTPIGQQAASLEEQAAPLEQEPVPLEQEAAPLEQPAAPLEQPAASSEQQADSSARAAPGSAAQQTADGKPVVIEHNPQVARTLLPNGRLSCVHVCRANSDCGHTCCREGASESYLKKARSRQRKPAAGQTAEAGSVTTQDRGRILYPNGKWSCLHPCRDKNRCNHDCCRKGASGPYQNVAPTAAAQSSVTEKTPDNEEGAKQWWRSKKSRQRKESKIAGKTNPGQEDSQNDSSQAASAQLREESTLDASVAQCAVEAAVRYDSAGGQMTSEPSVPLASPRRATTRFSSEQGGMTLLPSEPTSCPERAGFSPPRAATCEEEETEITETQEIISEYLLSPLEREEAATFLESSEDELSDTAMDSSG
ncbi:P-loop containing nucleoside triphosphate hydrolase protein [Penicillium ucsense]|uniref:DNA 3'-5' helicase n=1 Tax=Penicillium ucsense TaxID=2839758 RepID=A0A8J8W207_9EURO|nr:P-loop containing nucleoside triphosphate hydrolase protein [Penicillium ucsense]KAF7735944.1 P-loop containing nucleoside triphosphate hydrolase protein [Penicillium ucsense]